MARQGGYIILDLALSRVERECIYQSIERAGSPVQVVNLTIDGEIYNEFMAQAVLEEDGYHLDYLIKDFCITVILSSNGEFTVIKQTIQEKYNIESGASAYIIDIDNMTDDDYYAIQDIYNGDKKVPIMVYKSGTYLGLGEGLNFTIESLYKYYRFRVQKYFPKEQQYPIDELYAKGTLYYDSEIYYITFEYTSGAVESNYSVSNNYIGGYIDTDASSITTSSDTAKIATLWGDIGLLYSNAKFMKYGSYRYPIFYDDSIGNYKYCIIPGKCKLVLYTSDWKNYYIRRESY